MLFPDRHTRPAIRVRQPLPQASTVWQVAFNDEGSKVVAFDQEGRDHQVNVFPGGDVELVQKLRAKNVQFAVVPPPQESQIAQLVQGAGGLLINFLPLILLIGLNLLASRGGQGGMGGPGGPMAVGKSQSKIEMEPNTGVTFKDVAGYVHFGCVFDRPLLGLAVRAHRLRTLSAHCSHLRRCDGAKLELTEIVDFLKNPAKCDPSLLILPPAKCDPSHLILPPCQVRSLPFDPSHPIPPEASS